MRPIPTTSQSAGLPGSQTYYDDRPLPALAKKLQLLGLTNKQEYNEGLTAYFDEEFEEYVSDGDDDYDEDDDEKIRLTSKASKNDLKDVIDLYKQQLKRSDDPPTPTTFGGLDGILSKLKSLLTSILLFFLLKKSKRL